MDLWIRGYRRAMLGLAARDTVKRLSLRYGSRLAGRFVAAPTREGALDAVLKLKAKGIAATMDYLGESVGNWEEAAGSRDEILRLLQAISDRGLDAHVSVKPTQLGLGLDPEACCDNLRMIAAAAREAGTFLRIDMESSAYTQATLDLVRRLRAEGLDQVGAVVQACLRRSAGDADKLMEEKIRMRIVKGAYREPEDIAYQKNGEIIDSYRTIVGKLLDAGFETAVATHDDRLIRWVRTYAESHGIGRDSFEFQMLYGLRTAEQEKLAREGYRVRCYVPYGTEWYPYYTRRLAERPSHLWLVVRNFWK
ncbi:proline dehydrogenase family protein [Cohnella zeiphila]|uniref:proline dehydrogenase n=1 Tax=Cohnella zeiphila TaxID=2761120 RepID=A0A7X0VZJ4_9BACL|nr:proline dehydrogenase family protein [Cohnella zeiphila]MBB6735622.1 proline dehydrogenase family protein [Cohnella zeiphila]